MLQGPKMWDSVLLSEWLIKYNPPLEKSKRTE